MLESTDQYNLRVYYEDTDAGGVVYHANYLKFFERARTEWLRKLGIEQSYFLAEKTGFVVRDLTMNNLAAAKFDDLLTVFSAISEIKRASVRFEQKIVNQDEKLLCTLTVRVAYADLVRLKPCHIPDTILGALNSVS